MSFNYLTMTNSNQICFFPDGDPLDGYFGSSVAVNQKYLVIGDQIRDCVTVYQKNHCGEWVKSRKILAPEHSVDGEQVYMFGTWLKLEEDTLLIVACIDVNNPEDLQDKTELKPTRTKIGYLVKLDSLTELEPIEWLEKKSSQWLHLNLLSEGKMKPIKIPIPNKNEKFFGSSIALHKDQLIIGSPSYETGGGAWLYNIAQLENEPLNLTYPNVYMGRSVGISEQFAVVGHCRRFWNHPQFSKNKDLRVQTSIKNFNNGLITTIDNYGVISLDGNILSVLHPENGCSDIYSCLRVFRLDENAKPHLILSRDSISHAWVQNGFLVTVLLDVYSGIRRVCVESLV